jgi:predicted transcriptional regulator
MLYTALYMAATRTQIYLTGDQRRRLDQLARAQDRPLAELIREAVDIYLATAPLAPREALDASFGSLADLETPPRSEWDRG